MSKMLWSAVFMALLLSGCGWSGTPTRGDDFSPVTSITISADYSTIAKGTSVKLKATGHVSGLGTRDLTDKVSWSSSDTTKASFNSSVFPSRVTGVDTGNAISIKAQYGTLLSDPYSLTVSGATISSIVVTPTAPSVAKGLTRNFVAIGTFSDNTTQDITLDSGWTSSATGFVTVSDAEISKGLAKAVDVGSSTISATFNSIAGSTELTVTKAVVQSIAVTPLNPILLSLSTRNFTATGTYSDGSTADITSSATWSSSDVNFATMNKGAATALSPGSAVIRATMDSVSGNSALTVTGGTLSSIAVTPLTVTLAKDTRTRIKAVGTFTNGTVISTRDITGAVVWTTTDPALATVTSGGGNLKWLNAVAATPGTTVTATAPTATSTGKTGTATLVVTPPTLSSIALTPGNVALTAGTSSSLTLMATFSDGTTQDVTAFSTFTSSDDTKVTVGASGLSTTGYVTGVAAGTTTVSASYGGKTAPTPASVTVTTRTILSLNVAGSSSVTVGNQIAYAATAVYGDGTSTDVTANEATTWSSSATNVIALADSVNQKGQIVAISSGTATLTANFGGKNTSVTITVP